MRFEEVINNRLDEMDNNDNPDDILWPENCAGSRKALVIFIGPSPGGSKEEKRRDINLSKNKPLWNRPYLDPLKWRGGFRKSFKPIVEKVLNIPYDEASKIIARFNLDWMPNPESEDVPLSYMREGFSYILPIVSECKPSLVIPMDKKTFGIFQDGLILNGYDVDPVVYYEIRIKIWEKEDRSSYHRDVLASKATKDDHSFLIINSFQHPSKILNGQYALRIGKAIRLTAEQIWNGEVVNFTID